MKAVPGSGGKRHCCTLNWALQTLTISSWHPNAHCLLMRRGTHGVAHKTAHASGNLVLDLTHN